MSGRRILSLAIVALALGVAAPAYAEVPRFEVSSFGAVSFIPRLHDPTAGFGLSLGYAIDANFGIEFQGSYLFPGALQDEYYIGFKIDQPVKPRTEMLWTAGVGAVFRPIRIHVGSGSWDGYVGLGAALGETRIECSNQSPLDPNRGFPVDASGATVCNPDMVNDPPERLPPGELPNFYEPNTLRPMATLSAGVRGRWSAFVVRVEVRNYMFAARTYRGYGRSLLIDDIEHRLFLQAGAGVAF